MLLVDTAKADIQQFLDRKEGELLYNERDLQMHLALHLINSGHYDDVDVEYYVPYEELDNYIWKNELKLDILLRKNQEFLPVELKYKTKKHSKRLLRFGEQLNDDVEVLKALLKAVEDYGREKGMKEIIGPLGFTDMDPEGMLIRGFEELGTMATIYNYEYYPKLMEQMDGYEKDNDYVEYKVFVPKQGMPEKLAKIAQMIEKRYNLHCPQLKRSQVFGPEQYGQKVLEVVNKTFGDLYGYSQMTQRQIDAYVHEYFKFFSMDMLCVIEDWNTPDHDVIGVGITIPSLTKALQKCRKGRLLPFGWWHLIRALKFHKTDIVDMLLIGILPEYRSKGANALLFYHLIPVYQKYGFKWGESHVHMESNTAVQAQWQYFDNEQHKQRRCYKKAL